MRRLLIAFSLAALLQAQPATRIEPNVIYGMYSGLALLMDVHHPVSPNGYAVVYISGSGWHAPQELSAPPLKESGQAKLYATRLAESGYTVFSISHRAAPRFKYPAAVEDAQRAVRFVRHNAARFGVRSDRIGAVGGSSGGHLVLMLGTLDGTPDTASPDPVERHSAKVQSVVARAAPAELARMGRAGRGGTLASFLGMQAPGEKDRGTVEHRIYSQASPLTHVSSDDPPILLMHGDADATVPFEQSELMQNALRKAGVATSLLRVPGGGHGATFEGAKNPPDYMGEMIRWLDTHLKTARSGRYYFPPPGEGLEVQQRWTPEQAGLNPAVLSQLDPLAPRWAIWRYGRLIHIKGDFNQSSDVASNRKTWHAMIAGAFIQQGRIPSLVQKVSHWNPELKTRQADVTWWHLLTQSAGLDYPYANFPAFPPGRMWTYSDLNLVQLCDALARVHGNKDHRSGYEEVARAAYFDAIGLRGWRTGFSREDDGIRFLFDLEDMGRLGLLACARGNWAGRQLVPEWFVQSLETKQTRGMRVNYKGPNDGKVGLDPAEFPEVPYGFLTWVNTDGDLYPGANRHWTCARGAGGHITLWNHDNGFVWAAAGWTRPHRAPDAPQVIESNLRTR